MRIAILTLTLWIIASPVIAAEDKEFDGACAWGLAKYGAVVETDCSITWTNPETKKSYCFSSDKSKWSFLEDPEGNTMRAEKKAEEMHMMMHDGDKMPHMQKDN